MRKPDTHSVFATPNPAAARAGNKRRRRLVVRTPAPPDHLEKYMRMAKTGRRASKEERHLVQQLIDRYRMAEASPTGSICLNPESPEQEREYFSADPEELLTALVQFVEHGTFQPLYEAEYEVADVQGEFDTLRSRGLTYEEAVAQLAGKRHKSTRTIERLLARNTVLYDRN